MDGTWVASSGTSTAVSAFKPVLDGLFVSFSWSVCRIWGPTSSVGISIVGVADLADVEAVVAVEALLVGWAVDTGCEGNFGASGIPVVAEGWSFSRQAVKPAVAWLLSFCLASSAFSSRTVWFCLCRLAVSTSFFSSVRVRDASYCATNSTCLPSLVVS